MRGISDNTPCNSSTRELDELRRKVLQTGGLVEGQLVAAVDAMVNSNAALAEQVIADDRKVNELELAIDEEAALILARRSPVAGDLRLVFAVIKSITDLERMGDESVRIARMALRNAERGAGGRQRGQLRHLADHVRKMLNNALDAFARLDVELATSIIEEDRAVDREYDSLTRELITYMMEDPRAIPAALDIQWAARALERIGDRSCNLAEYVVYLTQGTDIRHGGLDKMLERDGTKAEESD